MTESEFVAHEPCPRCGSRDNLARYDDGHGHCFGCGYYEQGEGSEGAQAPRGNRLSGELVDTGEVQALVKRGISEDTCKLFGYTVSSHKGRVVQVAAYRDKDRRVVAQKLRDSQKNFVVKGDLKAALPLWGQHLWREAGRKVVVTEGEIDCLSVSQAQGNRWPVVSVPNGAQGAPKAVGKALEWLARFDDVVLMFDDDEPGREAARECAGLLPPGKAKLAFIEGFKDPNEALLAGKGSKIIDAIWQAKPWRPDGVVSVSDLREAVMTPIPGGHPWWSESLTKATHGRRPGEVYSFGAGTGVGKTDFFTQQAAHDILEIGLRVGMIYLEMPPVELARRLAGKVARKRFHLPTGEGDSQTAALAKALDTLDGKVFIYDHWGEQDWDEIALHIRHMVKVEGVETIYIDHLTALADPDDERSSLEKIMKGMASLAQELGCIIHVISHLATPEGKPHEEGGRVSIRHFKGSRAIGFWSFAMIGLERDQQAEGEEDRKLTTVRVLKERLTGSWVGHTFSMSYDEDTGTLYETTGEGEFFTDEEELPF